MVYVLSSCGRSNSFKYLTNSLIVAFPGLIFISLPCEPLLDLMDYSGGSNLLRLLASGDSSTTFEGRINGRNIGYLIVDRLKIELRSVPSSGWSLRGSGCNFSLKLREYFIWGSSSCSAGKLCFRRSWRNWERGRLFLTLYLTGTNLNAYSSSPL